MKRPIPVVRLIVPDGEGRVLVLRRREGGLAPGAWCLPGGKVDYGETARAAVERELREETSLACREARFLFFQDGLPSASGAIHCINLVFECQASGNAAPGEESSELAWIGSSDLKDHPLVFLGDQALTKYWKEKSTAAPP